MKPHPKIFVASTLDGLDDFRERVQIIAESFGCNVTYHTEDDGAKLDILQICEREIKECDGFLIILWDHYGRPLPNSIRSLAHEQVEIAIKHQVNPFIAYLLNVRYNSPSYDQVDRRSYDGYRELQHSIAKTGLLNVVEDQPSLYDKLGAGLMWLYEERVSQEPIILVSSTFIDLEEERKEMETAIRFAAGAYRFPPPVFFENLPRCVDPYETSRRLAEKCDVYLGLLSDNRGTTIPGKDKTYTELEYETTREAEKPIVIFENPNLPSGAGASNQSFDERERAREFNQLLRERHGQPVTFDSPQSLKDKVYLELSKLKRAGKLRTRTSSAELSEAVRPPAPYFVHPYSLAAGNSLVARERELELLDAWIDDPQSEHFGARVYCIEALGGMGKSALAWEWVNRLQNSSRRNFEAIVWYSFYSVEAGVHELAESVLPYLMKLSRAGRIIGQDLSAQEQMFRILEQHKVLLVLDGFERRMKLYTDFNARSAEFDELERLIEERIERHKLIFADLDEPEVARERARRELFEVGEADRRMLKRLAENQLSRTLITSRFFPSDLQRENSTDHVELAEALPLEPFGKTEALKLARSMDVRWYPEFDRLLWEVQGYPLYLALAFDYIRGEPRS